MPDTDPPPTPPAPPAPAPPAGPPSDEPLGEPGLRALNAERDARRAAEARVRELEPLAAAARAAEDAQKTELQRAQDRATQAEQSGAAAAADLLRLDVALGAAPAGMPLDRVRGLARRLNGTTREELEADATDLFAQLAGPPPAAGPPGRRPAENLTRVPIPATGEDTTRADMDQWMRRNRTPGT